MTEKDCKTCENCFHVNGVNFCRHLHECKGGSPFIDDVETLKELLKEAREVLEYYKNTALEEEVIYELPAAQDRRYRILNSGTGTISGSNGDIEPVFRSYLKYDKETADKMIKKIDEVL